MIPDLEIFTCKEIFLKSSSHESLFGLARLYCFEGKFFQALEPPNKALSIKDDKIYRLWQCFLSVKTSKQIEPEIVQKKSLFDNFLCCSLVKSQSNVIDMLQNLPEDVEVLWNYMELSMKGYGVLDQPEYYASKIKDLDKYIGYLAWCEVYFKRNDCEKGKNLLKELINCYINRPEAYVKLWYYFYQAKDYGQAEGVLLEAFLMISQEYHQFHILFCIFSSKTLFKLKRCRECIDLLQRKYLENPTYPVFLYHYGRYCTKSEDFNYNGSAIGALHECIRLCDISRFGLIYYWMAKAYMICRQYLEAYDTVKLALMHLDPSYTKKMAELKIWLFDIQPSINKIAEVESILLSSKDLDEIGYKRCKELCNELKDLHKLTVDVLYAKMLWKIKRYEEALKKLYAVSGISTVKMMAYFSLLQFLEEKQDIKCMKTVACEMVLKCKNPKVPAHVWVKANLLYAKILKKSNKPGKAILVLKCMAKVLPPIPFANIPYTNLLKRAKSIHDLAIAYSDSVVLTQTHAYTYAYSTYKNSFITPLYDAREFSHKIIGEETAPLPMVLPKDKQRRPERLLSERVIDLKHYHKKKTHEATEFDFEDKKDQTLLGIAIPSINEFRSLSFCSDPIFLYKISKISIQHNICIQDGFCAIKDYIELLKFEKDEIKRAKLTKKAEKIINELYQKIQGE